jgi:hypothetical protein
MLNHERNKRHKRSRNIMHNDDDDVYLDRITQHKPKTVFHMSNIDQLENA